MSPVPNSPTLPPGTMVLKPLPKGVAATFHAQALTEVSGLVVREEQLQGLSAAQTILALRLFHSFVHPSTGARVFPYYGDDGQPLRELSLLRFPLTAEMAAQCLVPTSIDLLQRLTEAQRMQTPYIGFDVTRTLDGAPLKGAPFLGSGVCSTEPLVMELFLLGRFKLPPGTELILRR